MYLMKEDIPVMDIDIEQGRYHVLNEKLLPIALRGAIDEVTKNDDLSTTIVKNIQNQNAIMSYFSRRMINLYKENAKKILNAYNFSQSQDPLTKTKIAIACKAVSMTDSYWLKPENSDLQWKDLNPRKNSLNKIVTHIMLTGSSLTLNGIPHTPELTGQGSYAKAWYRENDETFLLKKGTKDGKEIQCEVSVSNILDCFNVPHVKYTLASYDGAPVSKCKNMASDDLSIVPAEEIYLYCTRNDLDFLTYIENLDQENLYKMCIVDYLISNPDRHMMNWGAYMNNHTGNLLCLHPLFDHNNSFDDGDMKDNSGGKSLIFTNKTKKEAAEYAISRCDFRVTKPVTKEMFPSQIEYESFMKRACELALYKENKKTWKHKLKIKPFERFSPCLLHEDNSDVKEYYNQLSQKMQSSSEKTIDEVINSYKEVVKEPAKTRKKNDIIL